MSSCGSSGKPKESPCHQSALGGVRGMVKDLNLPLTIAEYNCSALSGERKDKTKLYLLSQFNQDWTKDKMIREWHYESDFSWVQDVFQSNSSPPTCARTAFTYSHPLSSSGLEIPRPKSCSASPLQDSTFLLLLSTPLSKESCSLQALPMENTTNPESQKDFLSKSWGFIEIPGQGMAAITCKAEETKGTHNLSASEAVLLAKN